MRRYRFDVINKKLLKLQNINKKYNSIKVKTIQLKVNRCFFILFSLSLVLEILFLFKIKHRNINKTKKLCN